MVVLGIYGVVVVDGLYTVVVVVVLGIYGVVVVGGLYTVVVVVVVRGG